MPRAKPVRAYLTPPEIGAELGVRPETVISWIRAGELRGSDVARRGAARPRFRVRREDFEAFLDRRAIRPSAPSAPRRVTDPAVTRYV